MTIKVYGFRLLAADGSISDWAFYNLGDEIRLSLRLKNGSSHIYSSTLRSSLSDWAAVREFKVESCVFEFDPVGMSFIREV